MKGRPRSVVDIAPPDKVDGKIHLTHSEYRMLRLLRQAVPVREITAETGWSIRSIQTYTRNLAAKLQVHGRLGVATYGASWDDTQFSISPKRSRGRAATLPLTDLTKTLQGA